MALRTFGTNAANSLQAVMFHHDPAILSYADLASFNALVKPDRTGVSVQGTALSREGLLYIPGRGNIRVFPGDYVCIDATTGWPFVLAANAVANGPYTHS